MGPARGILAAPRPGRPRRVDVSGHCTPGHARRLELRGPRCSRSSRRANDARLNGANGGTEPLEGQGKSRAQQGALRRGATLAAPSTAARRATLASGNELSTTIHKTAPLHAAVARQTCPVCRHPSYSAAGVHPQCAQLRAESRRLRRASALVAGEGGASAKTKRKASSSWYRPCFRCGRVLHVRRLSCDCGQSFGRVKLQP